jgi:hypothetical protein
MGTYQMGARYTSIKVKPLDVLFPDTKRRKVSSVEIRAKLNHNMTVYSISDRVAWYRENDKGVPIGFKNKVIYLHKRGKRPEHIARRLKVHLDLINEIIRMYSLEVDIWWY